jgi:HSP20 family protein
MAMIRWKPFEQMGEVFDDMPFGGLSSNGWLAADVSEDNNTVFVSIHIPGIEHDKIDISVHDAHLHISGKREQESELGSRHYIKQEIKRGSFERTISLPCPVDEAKTTAEFKDGVLNVALPKLSNKGAQKIKVNKK